MENLIIKLKREGGEKWIILGKKVWSRHIPVCLYRLDTYMLICVDGISGGDTHNNIGEEWVGESR